MEGGEADMDANIVDVGDEDEVVRIEMEGSGGGLMWVEEEDGPAAAAAAAPAMDRALRRISSVPFDRRELPSSIATQNLLSLSHNAAFFSPCYP